MFSEWVSGSKGQWPLGEGLSPNRALTGFPHVHVFLTLYNGFLAPSSAKLTQQLLELGFIDVQVDGVPYGTEKSPRYDSKKAFLYCVKEAKDKHYLKFLSARALMLV